MKTAAAAAVDRNAGRVRQRHEGRVWAAVANRQRHHEVLVLAAHQQRDPQGLQQAPEISPGLAREQPLSMPAAARMQRDDLRRIAPQRCMTFPLRAVGPSSAEAFRPRLAPETDRACVEPHGGAEIGGRATAMAPVRLRPRSRSRRSCRARQRHMNSRSIRSSSTLRFSRPLPLLGKAFGVPFTSRGPHAQQAVAQHVVRRAIRARRHDAVPPDAQRLDDRAGVGEAARRRSAQIVRLRARRVRKADQVAPSLPRYRPAPRGPSRAPRSRDSDTGQLLPELAAAAVVCRSSHSAPG